MKSRNYKTSKKSKKTIKKNLKKSYKKSFEGKGLKDDIKKFKSSIKDKYSSFKKSLDKVKYNFEKKHTAKKIIKLIKKDPSNINKLDSLCDKLFCNYSDSETCSQYQDMKKNKSKYESDNLCKNYALTLK